MTAMLTTYEDFVARVESMGFIALLQLLPGLPALGSEIVDSLWHTGLDTDPWRWKDRVLNKYVGDFTEWEDSKKYAQAFEHLVKSLNPEIVE